MFNRKKNNSFITVPAARQTLNEFRPEIIVIGAGIVGASTANYLARAGLRVAVVDRAGVAGGTSSSGEGNLLVSDKVPGPELELAKAGLARWQSLRYELPDDFEYESKGGILVADTPSDMVDLEIRVADLSSHGVRCEILSAAATRQAEPYLSHDIGGAAFFPDDAQVQPMLATAALLREAIRHGAAFFPATQVTALTREPQGFWKVVTSNGNSSARSVVIAAGPWSPVLAELAGLTLAVQPRKGHILVTEPLPPLINHKVYDAGYTATVNSGEADLQIASVVEGTQSGTILIGSSRQLTGFNPQVEVRVLRKLAERAVRFFPALAQANALRAYTGFRAFTPDHLPVIGELPGAPGLYVNTGHEGAGIGLGPVSGQLLSQIILGQPTLLDKTPFDPGRFEAVLI